MPEQSVDPVELPEPNASLVLWRVSMEAFIAVSGRKKADKFLRIMADKLASEENLSQVLSIRPVSDALKVRAARRGAVELFSRYLPLFLARLPPK